MKEPAKANRSAVIAILTATGNPALTLSVFSTSLGGVGNFFDKTAGTAIKDINTTNNIISPNLYPSELSKMTVNRKANIVSRNTSP